MKRDNNRRPSGDGPGRRGPSRDSGKGSYSKGKPSDKKFRDGDSFSKKSESKDGDPFFKKRSEGKTSSYNRSSNEESGLSKAFKGEKSFGKSTDKKAYGKSNDSRKSFNKNDDSKPYGRSDDKKSYGRSEDRKSYGKSDDKKSYGKSDNKKTYERKDSSRSVESKPFTDKPSFKPNDESVKPEGKAVYRGRGKDEKPVFDWVPKSEADSRPRKRKFKNPFEKDAPSERPEYNFERLEKNHNRNKKSEDIRLNKYISNSGICSRREADELISKGEVKVNGQIVTELGYKVALTDRVTYRGKLINPEKPVYLLLNKPKDFITTTDDPMERKTVMHLVGNACEERVFPVGRLDRNTTGLLLFTNDGELAAKLSHPSNQIKKIYQVTLDKPLTKGDEEAIIEGLTLEDGEVQVDDMQVLSKDRTILGLEIHVGKNRIVRRIFAHLGYEVVGLDRVMYAGLDKKDLPRGRYRFLSEKEVIRLKFFI